MLSVNSTSTRLALVFLTCASVFVLRGEQIPGASPGAGVRYATDAYPGFDRESEIVSPERKEPRWFSFIFGPKCTNATEQFSYCVGLLREEDYSKARQQLDALVREWPTAPEASKAQEALAEVCMSKLKDYEDAFAEYRYLVDFYSARCDYLAIVDELYKLAGILRIEGKAVMFVRFANTVDVRRAYEACVLRAPGAQWVPEAMLIIASLREDEGKFTEAVKVYENLRNLHGDTDEAKISLVREANVRMRLLRDHGYNRSRCRDTIDFLKLALRTCRPSDAEGIRDSLEMATQLLEEEAYRGAKFYDSPTRTVRSAINAYEKFLTEYPESQYAESVRERLSELKEGAQ